MPDQWITPSAEQEEQARLVQVDLVTVISEAINAGTDPRVALAGIAAAAADTLTSIFGQSAVVPWFEMQATIARRMIEGTH